MVIIYDERCLKFGAPGHPESPERIRRAYEYLRPRYEFISPQPASEEDLLKVHTEEHLERLKRLEFFDPDSPRYEGIYEHAKLSAGAAILAAQVEGFSLMRPPGHHAARERVAGFCYLNNIAIAIRASDKKTLIVDIDGHHGDGTQAIFLGDPQVVFISLHSSPNYPGTGLYSEQNCYNYPLPFHCGDEIYLETLERALDIDLEGIEQLAISAGFDTFERDPLASLGLSSNCYYEVGKRLAQLKLPTFAVLEGGYDVESLGVNIDKLLQGLSSQGGT
jgi:acetoin utilization deacetylase AcuC-like enzyme